MTSTAPTDVTPPTTRRLVRRSDDQIVGGVAAALGTYTDVDPVLYRVTFAVLSVFGGVGVGLYAVGWLLIPRADQPDSAGERLLRRVRGYQGWRRWFAVAVAVIAALVLLDGDASGVPALILLGAVAYLVHRERSRPDGPRRPDGVAPWSAPATPAVTTDAPVVAPSVGDPSVAAPHTTEAPSAAWVSTPRQPRPPRSRLGLVTISVAALTAGWLIALRLGGASGLSTVRILAVEVAVLGAGLLVGARYGRARWLILPAGLLTLALVPAAYVHVPLEGGTGERVWRPVAGEAPYRLGIGDATLDLSDLESTAGGTIEASVAIGNLLVLVPDGVHVQIHAQSDIGAVTVFGEVEGGCRAMRDLEVGSSGPVTQLVVEAGIGHVEVRHA